MTFRVRGLDADGDMQFGKGIKNFLVDSPAAVAQEVLTRLTLWQGEWWLDLAAGTPWMQQVLGKPRPPGPPDAAIRSVILGTPYVQQMTNYSSFYDSTARTLSIGCVLTTAFGPVTAAPAPSGAAIASISPSGALVMNFAAPLQPARHLLSRR